MNTNEFCSGPKLLCLHFSNYRESNEWSLHIITSLYDFFFAFHKKKKKNRRLTFQDLMLKNTDTVWHYTIILAS